MSSKSKRRRAHPQARIGPEKNGRLWTVVLLAAIILFFSAIRFRLRTMSLERDEGEYAYAGQLILQGIPPYQLAYNMKLPGTYAAYALMMTVFGQSSVGIHLGMIVVNGATIILVFLLAKRLWDRIAGLAAAAIYGLLSNSGAVLGFAGHATHFVVLAALAGILVLLRALETKRIALYFLSGVFMGLAFVSKQPGLVFALFGAFYAAVIQRRELTTWPIMSRLATYSAGAAVPFALTCLILFFAGELGRMWFWTFSYASQYAYETLRWQAWDNLFHFGPLVVATHYPAWILAALGLVAFTWDQRLRKHALFAIGFLLFSWGGVCIGFYFRPHYFILVLPAVSLLAGVTVSTAATELSRFFEKPVAIAIPASVLVVALGISVWGQSDSLFRTDSVTLSREWYGMSPFPEAEVVSQYLKTNTQKDIKVAVLGSEPEIYFYSGLHSATGYIYVYPLFESQSFALQMQQEMAKEIEDNRPEYIVLVKVVTSWQVYPRAERWILKWFTGYLADHYQLVGVADEITPQTRYVWGDEARAYKEEAESAVEVYKRTNQPPPSPSGLALPGPSSEKVPGLSAKRM